MSSYVDSMFLRVKDSSDIESITYSIDSQYLIIEFKNKTYYGYKNVALIRILGFISAVSVGKYYHKAIKNNFQFEQLQEEAVIEYMKR
jgi:hypothetical protein